MDAIGIEGMRVGEGGALSSALDRATTAADLSVMGKRCHYTQADPMDSRPSCDLIFRLKPLLLNYKKRGLQQRDPAQPLSGLKLF